MELCGCTKEIDASERGVGHSGVPFRAMESVAIASFLIHRGIFTREQQTHSLKLNSTFDADLYSVALTAPSLSWQTRSLIAAVAAENRTEEPCPHL